MNLEYAAGIFDGEGYVYIFKKVKGKHIGYYVSVGITMCHYPTVKAFYDQFGGHLNSGSAHTNPKHRPQFMWGMTNQKAASFLKIISPYLLIKADEANVAIILCDHIEQTKYAPSFVKQRANREAILARREELFQQCKQLKRYSFTPLLRKGPGPNGKPRGRPPGR